MICVRIHVLLKHSAFRLFVVAVHLAFLLLSMASMHETFANRCGRLSDTTHTVFETNAKPGSYGYKPHSKYSNIMIEKEVQEFNKFKDANSFVKKYKQPLPSWWPMMPDGTIVTHLYRLLDEQDGSDIQHPLGIHPAIRHKLRENEPVDFRDIDLKKETLMQFPPATTTPSNMPGANSITRWLSVSAMSTEPS